MIEEGVVSNVEEELAGRAVFVGSTCHGDGATGVTQAVIGFVFDRRVRLFLLHLLVKTAALKHKARDHAVEGGVVIKTTVHVIEEVFHRNRSFLAIQFQLNIPGGSCQQNMGVTFRCQNSRRDSRKCKHSCDSRQSGFEHENSLRKRSK
ncbi:hypothetical protein D3C85_1259620 [compost metagenome]